MHPVKSECILTYYADYSIIMFMGILETVGLPSLGQVCRTLFLLRSVGGFSLTREVIAMVTYEGLFQYTLVILTAISLFYNIYKNKK